MRPARGPLAPNASSQLRGILDQGNGTLQLFDDPPLAKTYQAGLDTIEQMSELYSTSGQYDLLGKFYLEPEQDIGLFVTEKIQTLKGVKDTYTLITFNAFSGGRS